LSYERMFMQHTASWMMAVQGSGLTAYEHSGS